ncbi:ANTAR domain-containing protein [Kribbella sp. NBC_01245]|uniref:ANTAR domain-containing protein n=1 Tax=Kribbella sp. NBC_01245 TaxID=2903578 RepID=UPI002E2D539A|nr:ANTAR domain-containing protein [Kribbella sp. NBC_01245]
MNPSDPAKAQPPARFDRVVTRGPGLDVTFDFSPALMIGRLSGHLRGRTRTYLRGCFRSAVGQRPERFVVDASGLVTCDAGGLAALRAALEFTGTYAPPVAVAGLTPVYQRMLGLMRADQTEGEIAACATLAEAVRQVLANPPPATAEADVLLAEVRNLHRGMLTRSSIEQAKGALMVVYGIDPDTAFAMLSWYSRNGSLPLHDLAAQLLTALRERAPETLGMVRMDALLADLAHRPPQTADGAPELSAG